MLQRYPHDFGRIEYARQHHVDILVGLGVEPARERDHGPDLLDDPGALEPGALDDCPDGLLERTPHDAYPGALIARELEAIDPVRRAAQRDAAPRHDPCLDGRPRGAR